MSEPITITAGRWYRLSLSGDLVKLLDTTGQYCDIHGRGGTATLSLFRDDVTGDHLDQIELRMRSDKDECIDLRFIVTRLWRVRHDNNLTSIFAPQSGEFPLAAEVKQLAGERAAAAMAMIIRRMTHDQFVSRDRAIGIPVMAEPGALVGGGVLYLERAKAADLHRRLGEWLAG